MATSNEKLPPIENQAPPQYSSKPVPPTGTVVQPQPAESPPRESEPVDEEQPKKAPPEKHYCGYSAKCCCILWAILGPIIFLIMVAIFMLILSFLGAFSKSPENNNPCTEKVEKYANASGIVIGCYSCDTKLESCKMNMTKIVFQVGICGIQKVGRTAGCVDNTLLGCTHERARVLVEDEPYVLTCQCDTPLCNTWDKCECIREKIVPCDGSILKFNLILLIQLLTVIIF